VALRAADGAAPQPVSWADLQPGLARCWALIALQAPPRHRAGRMKQWLNLLRRRYPEAPAAFAQVRTVPDPAAVDAALWVAGARFTSCHPAQHCQRRSQQAGGSPSSTTPKITVPKTPMPTQTA